MIVRRRMRRLSSVLLLLFMVALIGVSLAAQNNAAKSTSGAAAVIDPEKIRAHVKFLASDLLEGRGTGQRGGDIAAEYIATQFELYGLKPGAENGSYFQDVPMVGVKTLLGTSFKLVPANGEAVALKNLDDFITNNESQTETADIDAPIVFVGYGITAPEYNWDDYKGVDLKGKVALLFVNEPISDDPKFFKGKALTYYGRWTYKFEETARHGAVGALIIHRPVELPVRLQAHVASQLHTFVSRNVIAKISGSDPRRADQAVIYTAHYDHLGINPNVTGDNIYNGAVDNGTGCAILLELARAWSLAKPAPARSILFAAVTAEEQGLLGSEYLGKHSPVPPGKISVDLNYDGLSPIGDPEETEVSGAERTTFYPVVESTAKEFGFAIRADSRPEAGHYYRSDHFSLARVGVPSFSINEGLKFKGHDAAWGEAQAQDYVDHRYHQPSDEYRSEMDFAGLAKMARFGFALGAKAASQQEMAGWQPDDEFEAARKKSEAGN